MKNFYYLEEMSRQNLNRRLSESNNMTPLTLNLTENELIDSDANQVDISRFDDSLHTINNNDITGIYPIDTNSEETNGEESIKQKAYVDFDLFYLSLIKARINNSIDQETYERLNERAKDN